MFHLLVQMGLDPRNITWHRTLVSWFMEGTVEARRVQLLMGSERNRMVEGMLSLPTISTNNRNTEIRVNLSRYRSVSPSDINK